MIGIAFLLLGGCGGGSSSTRSGGTGGTRPGTGGSLGAGTVGDTAGAAGGGGASAAGASSGGDVGKATSSGGTVGAGAATGVGGAKETGGSRATGGDAGAGGMTASGGSKASGGAAGPGGTLGSGGTVAAGGVRSSGGVPGSGGSSSGSASGAGGSSGSTVDGGTAGKPYKGVANCTCAERTSLKVSWYYNWTVTPDNCGTGGDFVPMYSNHPNTNPTAQAVSDQIDKLVSAGYQYVLGFNEPNKSDQANMTVADAIALWPAMTSNPAILVGSPATSADGQSWFQDFWSQAEAQKLRIDFIALHWYGWNAGSCDAKAANLESYIKWAENLTGNLPIWLTEWGCMNASNPDDATVQAFYQGALTMFAKHPRLERYAWYQWDPHNYLTNSDHSLTPLGQVYASEPATR